MATNLKLYALFSVLFMFFAIVFFFTISNLARADYTLDTGCTFDNEGTNYSGISPFGPDGLLSINNTEGSLSTDIYLYPVDDACDYTGSSVGINTSIPEGVEFGVRFDSPTSFKFWNFTDNEQIGTTQAFTPGAKGFSLNVYQASDPSNQNRKSNSYSFNIGEPAVSFKNPPFTDGLETPDFQNWHICVNLPANHGYENMSYAVTYEDDELIAIDSSLTKSISPTDAYIACELLPKSEDLLEGSYLASINLYGDYSNIFHTNIYYFEIVAGAQILVPASDTSPSKTNAINNCLSSGGIIDSIYSVGCKLVVTLFYPSDTALAEFGTIRENLLVKAPFSYFYQVTDALSGVTGSTGTIPTLTISTGTATAVDLDVDIFSPDTLNQYTSPTVRGLLRTLMEVVLYLAFFGFCLYEARKLFNKQQS